MKIINTKHKKLFAFFMKISKYVECELKNQLIAYSIVSFNSIRVTNYDTLKNKDYQ
jgi:hypothetical protein